MPRFVVVGFFFLFVLFCTNWFVVFLLFSVKAMPNWFRDSLIEFCNLFQTHYQPSIVAIIEKILISLYITTLCVNTRKIHHLYQRGLICRGISKHFITGLNIHFLGKRDILWYSLPVFSQTYHTHQRVFIYREITARSLWESFSQSIST